MKRLFLALVASVALICNILPPTPTLADSFQPLPSTATSIGTTTAAVAGVTGSCATIRQFGASQNPLMTVDCSGNVGVNSISCTSTPCGGGGSSYSAIFSATGLPGIAAGPLVNEGYNYHTGFLLPGFTIGHLAVSCQAFNATDAGGSSVYNALSSTGLGGGTITFAIINSANPFSSPLVLGSVVIPTSPQAGPYVTAASTTLGTPYTVGTNDGITTNVTAVSTTALQWVKQCTALVGT